MVVVGIGFQHTACWSIAILTGVIANFAMIAVILSGTGVLEYWAGLVLLGIGWNFTFVGGSTLLTEVYSVAEKGKVQGINDFLVFGTNAAASLSSGLIYHWYGFRPPSAMWSPRTCGRCSRWPSGRG